MGRQLIHPVYGDPSPKIVHVVVPKLDLAPHAGDGLGHAPVLPGHGCDHQEHVGLPSGPSLGQLSSGVLEEERTPRHLGRGGGDGKK